MPATPSRRRARLLAAALAASLLAAPSGAEVTSTSGDPEFNAFIDDGLRSLYDLDYDAARRTFQSMSDKYRDHPIGAYALATTDWWELTNEYDEKNPTLETRFLADAERAGELARRRIKAGDAQGDGYLCLGGALGLTARWEAIQGRWLSAYRHGKQAFNAQKKAIELNPRLYDAYLGVGIFHYYTATLPSVVKILAHLVFGGNKQQGLDEIRLAIEKGRFSRTAAQLFMVGILNNTEKDYPAALEMVRRGRKEFPRSSFFQFLEILTLDNASDWAAERTEAEDFLRRIERGEPSYRKKYVHRALFALGNSRLGEGDPAKAKELFDRAIAEAVADDRWLTWAYLNRGRTFDLLGRRDEAVADYRTVLSRRDVWELHDEAERWIKKPYRRGAEKQKRD